MHYLNLCQNTNKHQLKINTITFMPMMEAFMHSHIWTLTPVSITCLVVRYFLISLLLLKSHWIGCGGWSGHHGIHKCRRRAVVSTLIWTFMVGGSSVGQGCCCEPAQQSLGWERLWAFSDLVLEPRDYDLLLSLYHGKCPRQGWRDGSVGRDPCSQNQITELIPGTHGVEGEKERNNSYRLSPDMHECHNPSAQK